MKKKIKLSLIFSSVTAGVLPLISSQCQNATKEEIKADEDFKLLSIADIKNANYDSTNKVYKISTTTKEADQIKKEDIKFESTTKKYTYIIDNLKANKTKGELEIFFTQKEGNKEIRKFTIKIVGFYIDTDKFDENINFITGLDLAEKDKYTVKEYKNQFNDLAKLQAKLSIATSNSKDLATFLKEYEISIKSIEIEEVSASKGEANIKATFENKAKTKSKEITIKLTGFKKEVESLQATLEGIFDTLDVLENKKDFNVFNYTITDLRYFKNKTQIDVTNIFNEKGIEIKNKEADTSSYETDAYSGWLSINITFGWKDATKTETYVWSQVVAGFKEIKVNSELEAAFNVDLKDKSTKTAQEYVEEFNALTDQEKETKISFVNTDYQNDLAVFKNMEGLNYIKYQLEVVDNFEGKVKLVAKWQQWNQPEYAYNKEITGFVTKETIQQKMAKLTNVDLNEKASKTVEEFYITAHTNDLLAQITATTPSGKTLSEYLSEEKITINKTELIVANNNLGQAKLKLTLSFEDKSQENVEVEYEINDFKKPAPYSEDKFENLIGTLKTKISEKNYYSEIKEEQNLVKLYYTDPDTNEEKEFNKENLEKLNIQATLIDLNNLMTLNFDDATHKLTITVSYTTKSTPKEKKFELTFAEKSFVELKDTFLAEINLSLPNPCDVTKATDNDIIYEKTKLNVPTTTNDIFTLTGVTVDWPKNNAEKLALQKAGKLRVKVTYKNTNIDKEYFTHVELQGKVPANPYEDLRKLAEEGKIFTYDKTDPGYATQLAKIKEYMNNKEMRIDIDPKNYTFTLKSKRKDKPINLTSLKLTKEAIEAYKKIGLKKKPSDVITHPSKLITGKNAYNQGFLYTVLDKNGKVNIIFSIKENNVKSKDFLAKIED